MKKCPVCSREYRDVVSLCPFDGANLTPLAASEAPTEFARPPAQPTVPLTPANFRERDDEETLIRQEPVAAPLPGGGEYRPNAANAASLPHHGENFYGRSQEETPEPVYNANMPPVVTPLGPGPGRVPARTVQESNPWRIATIALAGLIVVFLGAWFMLGGAKSGANSNDPMAVDPNSMNVNTAPPVTGMENAYPPLDNNLNTNISPVGPPVPGQGMGPSGGPVMPFPSGPPPSIRNLNENSAFPPPVTNNNVPNVNMPAIGGPTPKPVASPRPGVVPTPGVSVSPRPSASPLPLPAGSPKPAASPKPAVTPPSAPKATPKPTPSGNVEPF